MIIIENKVISNLLSILFILIPFSLILGPFFPDLFLVIIIISFFTFAVIKKDYSLFKNSFLNYFLVICLYFCLISFLTLNLLSIKSSFFYFRFGVFAFLASYLIYYNNNIFRNLFYLFLAIYTFLFIDNYILTTLQDYPF